MTTYDDPLRLRILKAMCAVIAGVTPAAGYKTNLSGKGQVSRGRSVYGQGDPLPLVSIIEPPIFPDPPHRPLGTTTSELPWDIIVQGFVADDKAHPTDPAHVLLADVKKALALEIKKLQTGPTRGSSVFGVSANRIKSATLEMGFVRPSDDVSSKAYFWLPVRLVVIEDSLKQYDD